MGSVGSLARSDSRASPARRVFADARELHAIAWAAIGPGVRAFSRATALPGGR